MKKFIWIILIALTVKFGYTVVSVLVGEHQDSKMTSFTTCCLDDDDDPYDDSQW